MSFVDGFDTRASMDTTENGGLCYRSSGGGALLDFFSIVGSMRNRDEADIIQMYHAARKEDKELADKIALYVRDVRGVGLGERRIGRILLKEMAFIDPKKVERNFQTFVDYGRWDDLYSLVGTPCEMAMWKFMGNRFIKDCCLVREYNAKNNKTA